MRSAGELAPRKRARAVQEGHVLRLGSTQRAHSERNETEREWVATRAESLFWGVMDARRPSSGAASAHFHLPADARSNPSTRASRRPLSPLGFDILLLIPASLDHRVRPHPPPIRTHRRSSGLPSRPAAAPEAHIGMDGAHAAPRSKVYASPVTSAPRCGPTLAALRALGWGLGVGGWRRQAALVFLQQRFPCLGSTSADIARLVGILLRFAALVLLLVNPT